MPNWVTTEIKMKDIGIRDLYRYKPPYETKSGLKFSGRKEFDLNKIVERPEEIDSAPSGLDSLVKLYALKVMVDSSNPNTTLLFCGGRRSNEEFLERLRNITNGDTSKTSNEEGESDDNVVYLMGINKALLGNKFGLAADVKELDRILRDAEGYTYLIKHNKYGPDWKDDAYPEDQYEKIKKEWPEDPVEAGKKAYELICKYGAYDWYTWDNTHWGTKWNATETYIVDDDTIEIRTAWSPPIPALEELSKQNPYDPIHIEYIDEGLCFVGESEFLDGLLEDHEYDVEDPRAIEIGQNLWGYDISEDLYDEDSDLPPAFSYLPPIGTKAFGYRLTDKETEE